MPLVTVITGYYNRADALDVTIDSIMNQSFKDFEFIVFNDCSTDDTKYKLEQIKDKYNDPRLIVRNFERNLGFVDGLKLCISEAKGDFICIQGSGDYSYPTRIEKQANALLNDNEISVTGCFYENYVEDRNIIRLRKKNADSITKHDLIKGNVFSHGEVMFRKSDYLEAGGYRSFFKNCQDYDLWLRMIEIGKFHTVKETLYRRFIRYDGVSYQPSKFLKQTRYFHFCKQLNVLSLAEQIDLINKAQNVGIEDFISIDSYPIQKRIIAASLRSVAWQKYEEAKELVNIGVSSFLLRVLLKLFVELYSSKLFFYPRHLVSKKIGLLSVSDSMKG